MVTQKGNAECELGWPEFGNFPSGLEKGSKSVILGSREGSGEDVINVDTKNDCASGRATYVNTPFTTQVHEIPTEDCAVECFVPHMASLFHPVDTL